MKYAIAASVGDVAEQIMTHRQAGTAISQLMPVVQGNDLFVKMLLDAYQKPRFSSPEYKSREIEDYRNLWETGCYQAMTEKGA